MDCFIELLHIRYMSIICIALVWNKYSGTSLICFRFPIVPLSSLSPPSLSFSLSLSLSLFSFVTTPTHLLHPPCSYHKIKEEIVHPAPSPSTGARKTPQSILSVLHLSVFFHHVVWVKRSALHSTASPSRGVCGYNDSYIKSCCY